MRLLLLLLPPALVTAGLYPAGSTDITVLDAASFQSELAGRPHAWMVEFYASWCGYCQNLAPTFTKLAREMAGWGEVVRVGVIDCGDEVNNQAICKHASIEGFPTIKYYTPNVTRALEEGVNAVDHGSHDKETMKSDAIDFLEAMIGSLEEEAPSHDWPNLQPINPNNSSLNFEDLWPEGNQETFLVVETERSYLGREVILNTWRRWEEHPVVERMVAEPGQAVMARLGVTSLPAVLLLSSEEQAVTALEVGAGDLAGLLGAVRDQAARARLRDPTTFRRSSVGPAGRSSTEPPVGVETDRAEVVRRRYSVFLPDLEKTVLFALQQEVAVQDQPDPAALNLFLEALVLHFPRQSALLPHLARLRDQLASNATLGPQLAALPAPPEEWVGCRGSALRYGGFPCGLWQLWHTLTIAQTEDGDPGLVLRAMVAYVREFFACRECAEHFLEMVQNGTAITEQVNTPTDAALFLWAAHNAVNLRLAGAPSEDPAFPKVRFPAVAFCPDCWAETADGEEPREEAVLASLRSLYSADQLVEPGRGRQGVAEAEFDYTGSAAGGAGLSQLLGILGLLLV